MHNTIDWTPEIDEAITSGKHGSLTATAHVLGLAASTVSRRARMIGIPTTKPDAWTDEEINILKDEWEKGSSGSQIAAILGNKTRNAVIGKAHRLNLAERKPNHQFTNNIPRLKKAKKPAARQAVAIVANKKATPPRFFSAHAILTSEPPISMMELRYNTCRAVVGTGADGLATYCGDMTFTGKPFCEGHCALFYRPPEERRRYRG